MTNEEKDTEISRLRASVSRRDENERREVITKLDVLTTQVQRMESHCETINAHLKTLQGDVKQLKIVVCGEPGKEDKAMTTRLKSVEITIIENNTEAVAASNKNAERKSWAFRMSVGAAFVSLLALCKDWISRHF